MGGTCMHCPMHGARLGGAVKLANVTIRRQNGLRLQRALFFIGRFGTWSVYAWGAFNNARGVGRELVGRLRLIANL
jgi:hypothetical protein